MTNLVISPQPGNVMPVPVHTFDPPFNIIRCSHAVLDVTNLETSRKFYESIIGLHVEDADENAVLLRGSEEHQHHSLVLRKMLMLLAAAQQYGILVRIFDMKADDALVEFPAGLEVGDVEHRMAATDNVE